MTAIDTTLIPSINTAPRDPDLAADLSAALAALGRTPGPGTAPQWVLVAVQVPRRPPARRVDRRLASLDFAAWHAHLAGHRQWVPDGQGGMTV